MVPDPGVLISAAISEKGAPWEVLRRWMAGGFEFLREIEQESRTR